MLTTYNTKMSTQDISSLVEINDNILEKEANQVKKGLKRYFLKSISRGYCLILERTLMKMTFN